MALTIGINGKGVIANCDALSDSAGGTWTEEGGGTISVSTDVYLYNGSCIGGQYASKSGFQQYDLGVGNELDFTGGGTEEGQFIYIWVAMTALGTLDTLANNALAIRVSSDSPGTTNYKEFLIAGNDGTNGWTGGWKCFVIDPTLTASRSLGTVDLSAILTLGVWIDCSTSARADSIFIDQISVGDGLRIEGTSTIGWADTVAYCTDYGTARAWGMWQDREGIYYSYGKTYIGDAVNQAANVSFTDSGRVIQFGTSQYYESAAWKTSYPITACGIVIEDHTSYTTTFDDGIIVGTDQGRSGTTFLGNSDMNVSMDLYGGNNTGSLTRLYGSRFGTITGLINFGNDAQHLLYSVGFAGCSQVDPVGAPIIRNCTFAETADVDSSLLWNESIDIQKCSFIANTIGAAIEHPSAAGTPYSHDALLFSGNTFDVLNSSGSAITIEKSNLSNGSTSEGSAVTFENSISINIHVQDSAQADIVGALVYVDENHEVPYIINTTSDANGDVSGTYTGAATSCTIRIRKYGYKPYVGTASLTSDISLNATLVTDPQQT